MTFPLSGSSGHLPHQSIPEQRVRFQTLGQALMVSVSNKDSRMLTNARALESCAREAITHLTQTLQAVPAGLGSQCTLISTALDAIKSEYQKVYHLVLASGFFELSPLGMAHLEDALAECEQVHHYLVAEKNEEALAWAEKMRPALQQALMAEIKEKLKSEHRDVIAGLLRSSSLGDMVVQIKKSLKPSQINQVLKKAIDKIGKDLAAARLGEKGGAQAAVHTGGTAQAPRLLAAVLQEIAGYLAKGEVDQACKLFKELPPQAQASVGDKIRSGLKPDHQNLLEDVSSAEGALIIFETEIESEHEHYLPLLCQKAFGEVIKELEPSQGPSRGGVSAASFSGSTQASAAVLQQIVQDLKAQGEQAFTLFEKLPVKVQDLLADKIHQQLSKNQSSREQPAQDLVSMVFGSLSETPQTVSACQKALQEVIKELEGPRGPSRGGKSPQTEVSEGVSVRSSSPLDEESVSLVRSFDKDLSLEAQAARACENFEAVRASSDVSLLLSGYQDLLALGAYVRGLDARNSMKSPTLVMLKAQVDFLKQRIVSLIAEKIAGPLRNAQAGFAKIIPPSSAPLERRMTRNCDIIHSLAAAIGASLHHAPITRSIATTPYAMIQDYKKRYPYLEAAADLLSSVSLQTFPGLNNQGSVNCWANALLQMMVTVPSIAHVAKKVGDYYTLRGETPQEQEAGRVLITQIDELAASRSRHALKTSADSQKLRLALSTLFPGIVESGPVQEDASGVLGLLLGRYEQVQPAETNRARLPGLFEVKRTKHYQNLRAATGDVRRFSNLAAHGSQEHIEVGGLVQLNLSPLETKLNAFRLASSTLTPFERQGQERTLFAELLEGYFNPQGNETAQFVIEGQLRECQADGEKVRFTHPPEEFVMTSNRFGQEGGVSVKLKHSDGAEMNAPLFERFTLPAGYTGGVDASYEVDSFVVQAGELNSGHYYSYQKIEGQWYLFNDEQVRPVSAHEVQEQLNLSYFQHYKKMEAVDPSAVRVPVKE